MKTAILKDVMVEVFKQGCKGYKWVPGYIIFTPEGNEVQPYMRCIEAKRYCKAQVWEFEIQND